MIKNLKNKQKIKKLITLTTDNLKTLEKIQLNHKKVFKTIKKFLTVIIKMYV